MNLKLALLAPLVLGAIACGHSAPTIAGTDKADVQAVHGMLVFGKSHVYFSHLPMFHMPHKYQVLLAVSLTATDGNTDFPDFSQPFYTIGPQPFVLPTIQSGQLTRFNGDLFKGVFDEGGDNLNLNVDVQIDRVIKFRPLANDVDTSTGAKYLLFGTSDEACLAHYITQRGDFDEIAAVALPPGLLSDDQLASAVLINLPQQDNATPIEVGPIQAEIPGVDGAQTLMVTEKHYVNFQDLQ